MGLSDFISLLPLVYDFLDLKEVVTSSSCNYLLLFHNTLSCKLLFLNFHNRWTVADNNLLHSFMRKCLLRYVDFQIVITMSFNEALSTADLDHLVASEVLNWRVVNGDLKSGFHKQNKKVSTTAV